MDIKEDKPVIKRKFLQWVFFIVVLVVIVILSYRLRTILNPLLLCLLIAYIINPAVVFFERRGFRRIMVVSVFFTILILLFLTVLFAVIPLISAEATYFYSVLFVGDTYEGKDEGLSYKEGMVLTNDLNKNGKYDQPLIITAKDELTKLISGYTEKYPYLKEQFDLLFKDIESRTKKIISIKSGQDIFNWLLSQVTGGIQTILLFLFYLILIPVYIFFLLQNLDKIKDFIYSYFPQRYKDKIISILKKIDLTVSSFTNGLLIKCLIKGIITVIGLYIVGSGVPFLFGVIQAVASLIPYLPLFIGGIPATIISAFQYSISDWHTLGVIGVFIFAEVIEGLILTPFIIGKKCKLNPIVVIISLLVGAELAGLFGVLIAVPCISIIKILWEEIIHPNIISVLNS